MADAPARLLVIRRRFLGDLVQLTALLRNVRLQWPGAQVTLLAEARFAEFAALNRDLDTLLPFPAGLGDWPRLLRAVRAAGFTHVVDLDQTRRTAALARLSRAPVRIAVPPTGAAVAFPSAYSHVVAVPATPSLPLAELALHALAPLGLAVRTREAALEPPADLVATLRKFVGASERVLLVYPGTRASAPAWPAERFARVIDYAQDALNAQVILVGGPNEAAQLAEIRGHVRTHLLSPPGSLSVGRFAALARISDAVLCHESGFMHVAAAVGTPVIALLGRQDPAVDGPRGAGHAVLHAAAGATGGRIDALSTEEVSAAVAATLRRPRKPASTS